MIRLNRIEKSMWLSSIMVVASLAMFVGAAPVHHYLILVLVFVCANLMVWLPKPGRDWRGRFTAQWHHRFERHD